MKLWVSKNSEVPVQEQLSTQIILGIVSADLIPGERLPSTSQLARRFHIHPNTVRAAYRSIAERGWLEWRQGSGFYVRKMEGRNRVDGKSGLDQIIATFLKVARDRGHSLGDIQAQITRWFSLQAPDHILVIDPDSELRAILVSEIREKIPLRVEGIGIDEYSAAPRVGAFCVALYDHGEQVHGTLAPETPFLLLHSRSIPRSLATERRPSANELITVVSRWPDFLHWARTTLIAVGIDSATLDLRDARQKGWDRGLTRRSFIITDSLLCSHLPPACHPRVFQLIADDSVKELREVLNLES